jgi:hypothetical protein
MMALSDEDVRDAMIAGLENHTAGVVNVRESVDPDSRTVEVEMDSGRRFHVDINIEIWEV